MMRALLIGDAPSVPLGYEYVCDGAYDAIVIGSLTLAGLLRFSDERVLSALAVNRTVLLYTPGLPDVPKNRALAASATSAQRELKNWGVVFTDGGRKRLITAQEAREMRRRGISAAPGAVFTPLAREIMEGKE